MKADFELFRLNDVPGWSKQRSAFVDAGLTLGLDGIKLNFVPRMGEVLYHTGLLEPRKSESIFFEAPVTPGDYPFVCSFPGHAGTMQVVMHVRR